ncbi:MAG: coproporphyrinogen III oxidase family protein [Elusimicrobia bacterium]|nr:coproporphyrinogen III oxidase family protein [Elusimicrobiota bacterium]
MKTIFNKIITKNIMNFDRCDVISQQIPFVNKPCYLYVHIPFCKVLCPYCSFHRISFNENEAKHYFKALRAEIRHYHKHGYMFSDVYIGGGTPTVAPSELHETLILLRSLFPDCKISVETNPDDLHDDILNILKNAGVVRLSVGVQSFDDDLLQQMGRYEKYGSGEKTIARLKTVQGKFQTLNVDMIINQPNQTKYSLQRDIDILMNLKIDQISFYPFMVPESVRTKVLRTMGVTNQVRLRKYYEIILNNMVPAYKASSAWCFSRNSLMIDEYIINCDDYIGVGSGAFSYVDGVMYSTTFSLKQYISRIECGLSGITRKKVLTLKQRMCYDFIIKFFGLSLDREYIMRKYGLKFWFMMFPEYIIIRMMGGIRNEGRLFRLTKYGMYLWIRIMSEFFNTVNTFREKMRLQID